MLPLRAELHVLFLVVEHTKHLPIASLSSLGASKTYSSLTSYMSSLQHNHANKLLIGSLHTTHHTSHHHKKNVRAHFDIFGNDAKKLAKQGTLDQIFLHNAIHLTIDCMYHISLDLCCLDMLHLCIHNLISREPYVHPAPFHPCIWSHTPLHRSIWFTIPSQPNTICPCPYALHTHVYLSYAWTWTHTHKPPINCHLHHGVCFYVQVPKSKTNDNDNGHVRPWHQE